MMILFWLHMAPDFLHFFMKQKVEMMSQGGNT